MDITNAKRRAKRLSPTATAAEFLQWLSVCEEGDREPKDTPLRYDSGEFQICEATRWRPLPEKELRALLAHFLQWHTSTAITETFVEDVVLNLAGATLVTCGHPLSTDETEHLRHEVDCVDSDPQRPISTKSTTPTGTESLNNFDGTRAYEKDR